MMRRESRPFVVERRRGQKRTPVVTTVEQPEPPPPPPENGLDEIFRRAEAALFDRAAPPQPKHPALSEDTGLPKGRILENLSEVDPLAALLAERGEASRRGRKPGSKNKPKDVSPQALDPATLANLKGRVELTPERINEALKAMERAAATSPPRGVKPARGRPARPVVAEAEQEESAVIEAAFEVALAAPTTAPAAEARPRERGSIRGRYVVGSELKPGERWKRRLRGVR